MNQDADFSVDYQHRVRFTCDAFGSGNTVLRDVMAPREDGPARALIFIDDDRLGICQDRGGKVRRHRPTSNRPLGV